MQEEDYTVDVESTDKASTILGYYAMDLQPAGDSIASQPMPEAAKAGVSIIATLKSVAKAWDSSFDSMAEEMRGLATACSSSVKLYHESEETVYRTFRNRFVPLAH